MKNGFNIVEILIIVAVLSLLAAIIIPSIARISKFKQTAEKEDHSVVSPSAHYQIVVVDECQYIESINRSAHGRDAYTLCHKGNCTNRVHFIATNLESK